MPARIHPFSLALGLILAVICFLAMGQSTVQTPLRVEYVPHPRDYVQIKEGTPYTVPAGGPAHIDWHRKRRRQQPHASQS